MFPRMAVVHFAGLPRRIGPVDLMSGTPQNGGDLHAGLFTVLSDTWCGAVGGEASPGPDPSDALWRWAPGFWADAGCLFAVASILAHSLCDPAIWVVGEYMPAQVYRLMAAGLVPPWIKPGPAKGLVTPVTLVMASGTTQMPPLPDEQGLGHFPGAVAWFFNGDAVPAGMYERWLALQRRCAPCNPALLGVTDTTAPSCTMAWAAPFGAENRQHALLAKRGWAPAEIGRELASRLSLPYIACDATEDAFWEWEAEHVLPAGCVAAVKAVYPRF